MAVLNVIIKCCLLYTSDAADEARSVDLGGRRIIKKYFTSLLLEIETKPKTKASIATVSYTHLTLPTKLEV
ncbi:hypothetical protein JMUB7533_26670 [Staphylococcus aureus]